MSNFTYTTGAILDPLDGRDYSYADTLASLGVPEDGELPKSINNCDEATPIKNQGKHPTCVGMAVACGAAEFQFWRKLGRRESFSPFATYRWAREKGSIPDGTPGAALRDALWVLRRKGAVPLIDWPLHEGEGSSEAVVNARQFRIDRYERLKTFWQLKHAIHQHGVALATVMVHTGWEKPTAQHLIRYDPRFKKHGYHGIAIMGYDDNFNDGVWIIRNSWGIEWGDGGIALLGSRDAEDNMYDMWVSVLEM